MPWPNNNNRPSSFPSGPASEKRPLGKGVFKKCEGCNETLESSVLKNNFEVCPLCGQHHRLAGDQWKALLLDDGDLEVWSPTLKPGDPLEFVDGKPYNDRVAAAQRSSGSKESVEIGRARMQSLPVAFGMFMFAFLGGSMGSVAGEKLTRLFEKAREQKLPVVLLSASGGARMQEGIFSLMQMAKTVAALERLRAEGLPFVSVLLHPTTGGVAASFALLGDINVAEPKALIGFAGPRVIENTIRQKLPEGFQRSEFLLEHGMVDQIVSRLEMKTTIAQMLRHLSPQIKPA